MKYTRELLEPIIKQCFSWAEVCRRVGAKPMTGSQSNIKRRAIEFGLDSTHFTGQGHNKGKILKRKDALEYCFNGSKEISDRLRKRLIRDGYKKDECEKCGISEWQGEKLSLELDHIDSNHFNNEFNNLQILCPNCHAVETKKRKALVVE